MPGGDGLIPRDLVQSGITVGALTAIVLNLIFRIGIKREQEHRLARKTETREAADAIERDGRLWGVRADTVARAGHAVGEALELLRGAGTDGPVTLTTSFDEFNLVTTLSYAGRALQLEQEEMPDAEALLTADEHVIDRGIRRISINLLHRLADRVQGSASTLLLSFNH